MRLVHTSDWHLGRIFYKTRLTEDQSFILEQFVDLVRDERPDVVMIAGDVYDRSAPPVEAVELLDATLSEIVLGLGVPTVVIAGNHDSPERLGFCSSLMSSKGLFVVGMPETARPIPFYDEHGPVWVVPVPYAEPAMVRDRLASPEAVDHDLGMAAQLATASRELGDAQRKVAVAHAYVYGGVPSESERPLTLGGTGGVDVMRFDGFSYVALGHLHRPQGIPGSGCRYAGSLMKYSFDEADHMKSVSVVEIDGAGQASLRTIALTPRHDLRRISGSFEQVLAAAGSDPGRDDYLSVQLSDLDSIWDAMSRLREVYPNVMQIERPQQLCDGAQPRLAGAGIDHRNRSLSQLFREFYEQTTGGPLDDEGMDAFVSTVERMKHQEEAAVS